MLDVLKFYLERSTPLGAIARFSRQRKLKRKYVQWHKNGSSQVMPDYGKQQVVIEYIRKFKPDVFVETGTYKGRMVYAVMPHINDIYSIELDDVHFANAKKRFAGYPNIRILHGQSGEMLPELMKTIDKPCLFWLDAHYSGGSTARGELETPIIQELKCILKNRRASEHIILIDDARCFTGQGDYPSLRTLEKIVLSEHINRVFEVENDIIRIHRQLIAINTQIEN